MTWKHNTPAGWAWLLFAGISFIIACLHDIPQLIAGLIIAPDWKFIIRAINVLSVAGLCQYAVRWRSPRTTCFWRIFAPAMLLTYTVMIAHFLPPTVAALRASIDAPLAILAVLLTLAIVVANTVLIAIAVLRLGDYLGPTRRPLGQKPAQLSLSLS